MRGGTLIRGQHYTNYTTLHYTTLHYFTLHYTRLHYTILHYSTQRYSTIYYSTLLHTTLHYANFTTPQLQLQLHYATTTPPPCAVLLVCIFIYIYIVHFTLYATDWRFRIFSLNFSIKMTPSMTVHVIHLHQQYTNPEKPQV